MESHPKWIHLLHSPEAWIALVVGGAEILIHEPSVRFALIVMLALGIAFAVFFRKTKSHFLRVGEILFGTGFRGASTG